MFFWDQAPSFHMDGTWGSIFLIIISLHCVHSAQWSFPEGAGVDACSGDVDATFPWAITLASGEEIADIQWLYHGNSEEMVAMFSHGVFLTMSAFSQRVQQRDITGLVLSHVTEWDTGNYSVEVIVRDHSTDALITLRHSAVLTVYSQSKAVADATVKMIQEAEAVWDNSTGQYHVTLSCLYHGRQPPAITWTLPSGASTEVWTSQGGKFSLLVPNPVSGGNYTCSLHPSTPAARCLPTNSPVLRGDTLYLDRVEARLTLLETEQQVLRAENSQQAASIQALQTENNNLKTENSQQISSIRLTLLETEQQALKAENTQQTSSIQALQTENNHLKTENSQQASSIQALQTEISRQASSIHALQTENNQQAFSIQALKTENSQLKTENSEQASSIQALQTENSQLKTENSQQASSIQILQTENSQHASSIQRLNDLASKRVAFHARIVCTTIQLKYGGGLVLTEVDYNQGNGYNSSTGVFTAPHSGTYTFLVTLRPYTASDRTDVFIMVDGTAVSVCYPPNAGDAHACVAVVRVNAGQRVLVVANEQGYFSYGGTAFSGFLVSPDP